MRRSGGVDVSIIIRTRNEERHLGELLSAIRGQRAAGGREVIVVDNGSTDRTLQIAREHGVDCIVNITPEQFSFGRAINFGCAVAGGRAAVLVSAHCLPDSDHWLQRLVAPLEDESVSVAYGRQRGKVGANPWSEIRLMERLFPEDRKEGLDPSFCNNANSAFRMSLWRRLPFDEEVTGLEDLHWARRWLRRGLRTCYVPEAAVLHVHEEAPGQIYRRFEREARTLAALGLAPKRSWLKTLGAALLAVLADAAATRRPWRMLAVLPSALAFQLCRHFGARAGARGEALDKAQMRKFYRHEEA